MSINPSPKANILWFLPTHGDGRYLGTTTGGREVNFNYLRQVAQAADQLGYFGVLLPTGRSCEDSWVVASAVAPWTERLRYLVAVRPGLQSPSVAARMTATGLDSPTEKEIAAALLSMSKRLDEPAGTERSNDAAPTSRIRTLLKNSRSANPYASVRSNLPIATAVLDCGNCAASDQPHSPQTSGRVDLTLAWAYV